jgi:hypothetical protein
MVFELRVIVSGAAGPFKDFRKRKYQEECIKYKFT